MAYQESPDHVPDPTAVSGTLDTTGIYGGHHESIENITGVFAAARARDLGSANTDELDDEATERVEQSAQEAQEHAEAVGAPVLPPNPFPEGTLHAGDVLTPEEQAQRLDPASSPAPVDESVVDAYDPFEHSVTEVNEYLGGQDEAERDRVLAAERAGKARKGVVGE